MGLSCGISYFAGRSCPAGRSAPQGMSAVAGFFVFLIVTGLICAAGGFVWIKVLDNSKKKQVVDVCIAMYYKTLGRFRFQ